jgi:hypothetical protein
MKLGWLSRELSNVTLLLGPDSVGKTKLAYAALAQHGGVSVEYGRLSAEDARQVVVESRIAPFTGSRKNFLICLDSASEQAQNTLLKVLEEPPVTARFMLTASSPPLPTITSRCALVPVGLLTDEEVERVLRQVIGLDHKDAAEFAPYGAGRVAPAYSAYKDREAVRAGSAVVSSVLKAALDQRAASLGPAMRLWEDQHTRLLHRWASERAAGRWRAFSEDFAPGVTQDEARSLLAAMSYYSGARQSAQVALESVFGNRS